MGRKSRSKKFAKRSVANYFPPNYKSQTLICAGLISEDGEKCNQTFHDGSTLEVIKAHFELEHADSLNDPNEDGTPHIKLEIVGHDGKRRPIDDLDADLVESKTLPDEPPNRRDTEPDREDLCKCGHYRWQHKRVTYPGSSRRDFLECEHHTTKTSAHVCVMFALDLKRTRSSRRKRESGE